MSGFLGFGDPFSLGMGMMGLAQGFGNAAGPSRMPIPMGAAFGSAAGGMRDAMTNAQKLKLLAAQEQRMETQNSIAQQEFDLKRQIEEGAQNALPGALSALQQSPYSTPQQSSAPAPAPSSAPSAPPANAQEFIQRYTPHALAAAQETGLDPRLILAQAGLESGWGSKAPGNNFFGIKGPGQTLATQESVNGQMVPQQASFRAYDSPEKSFQDYAAFIKGNPRYQSVMGAQGLDGQIDAMGRSGYATDPNYAGKLRMLARGIQIPEGAQPAQAGGGQPSAAADMGASPAAPMANLPPRAQQVLRVKAEEAWNRANQLELSAAPLLRSPSTKAIGEMMIRNAKIWREAGQWEERRDEYGRPVNYNILTGEFRISELPRTREIRNPDGSMRTELDRPGLVSARELPTGFELAPDGSHRRIRGSSADPLQPVTTVDAQGNEVVRQVLTTDLMQPQSGAGVTPGAGGVTSVKQPPAITTATRTDLEADTKNIRGALSRLEKARTDFDPSFLTMSGRGANAARSWVEWTTGYLPEGEKKKLEAYTAFTTNTVNTLNEHIKAITGAAMGVEEAKRLMAAMPNPNDSPTQFQAKLQVVEDGLRAAQERIGGMARTGIRGDQQSASPRPAPSVGAVLNGFRFKGGDPKNPASWEQVQ